MVDGLSLVSAGPQSSPPVFAPPVLPPLGAAAARRTLQYALRSAPPQRAPAACAPTSPATRCVVALHPPSPQPSVSGTVLRLPCAPDLRLGHSSRCTNTRLVRGAAEYVRFCVSSISRPTCGRARGPRCGLRAPTRTPRYTSPKLEKPAAGFSSHSSSTTPPEWLSTRAPRSSSTSGLRMAPTSWSGPRSTGGSTATPPLMWSV